MTLSALDSPAGRDAQCLRVGRCLVPVLLMAGVAVIILKQGFGSVFEAFQTFLSFIQGPLLALLLFGMLSRRANSTGALMSMVAGVLVAVLLTFSGSLFGVKGGICLWVPGGRSSLPAGCPVGSSGTTSSG